MTISIISIVLIIIIIKFKKINNRYEKDKERVIKNIKISYPEKDLLTIIKKIIKRKTKAKEKQYASSFITELITKLNSGIFFQKAWNETLYNFTNRKSYSKQLNNLLSQLHIICIYTNTLGSNTIQILENINKSIEEKEKLEIKKQISISPAKTTIKILSLLPILSISLGLLLGINPFEVLFKNPNGNICLVLGIIFYLCGQIWVKKLLENTIQS